VSADVDWALVEVEFVNCALTLFYYETHYLSSPYWQFTLALSLY
jgi:hypothetical protein